MSGHCRLHFTVLLLGLGTFASQPLFAASDVGEDIHAFLENLSESGAFSGSVAVVIGGHSVVSNGYGLANVEHNVPNTSKTKFRIASITKSFTAMAILLLQDRNLLSVEDTLDQHLSDTPTAWRGLKIRQLLNHTSGLPHPWKIPGFEEEIMMVPLNTNDLLSLYYDLPLVSEPGAEYNYSGVGYFALAKVIEEVSGLRYHEFLNEAIFDPLEMHSTGGDRPDKIIGGRASGYELADGVLVNAPAIHLPRLTGGGDLYSTVEDLQRWHGALAAKKLLSEDGYTQMFTPGMRNYGYGWQIRTHDDTKMVMHTGGLPGFKTLIMTFPELDSCIIILGNRSETNASDILDFVVPRVLGTKSD